VFFISFLLTGGISVTRKSGHICNAGLAIIQHGGWCPDLSGFGNALLIGNEIKKTSPCSSYASLLRKRAREKKTSLYPFTLSFLGDMLNDERKMSIPRHEYFLRSYYLMHLYDSGNSFNSIERLFLL
jgi:hypothetical protein